MPQAQDGLPNDGEVGIPVWLGIALAIIVAIMALVIVLGGRNVGPVVFQKIDWGSFMTLLLPFAVVAALIERTVQVLFGITNEPQANEERERAASIRTELRRMQEAGNDPAARAVAAARTAQVAQKFAKSDVDQTQLTAAVAQMQASAGDPVDAVRARGVDTAWVDVASWASAQMADSQRRLARNSAHKTRVAFYLSLSLGLLAATAGLRVLGSVLVDMKESWKPETVAVSNPPAPAPAPGNANAQRPAPQQRNAGGGNTGNTGRTGSTGTTGSVNKPASPADRVPGGFTLLDILLTAGLLSGGADGINRITSVLSNFLRDLARKSDNTR